MTKIAINGFGRIGRLAYELISKNHPDLEVKVINDLAASAALEHLFKYDSNYPRPEGEITAKFLAEKDPSNLPWQNMGIDIVLECTGFFTDKEGAGKHLLAGAKKVIISAPTKSSDVPTYLLGINAENYNPKDDDIISMGSCTTNAAAVALKVLDDNFSLKKAFLTTVHSYTSTQNLVEEPHKDLRRAREAALNIIPTTTGAAKTIEKVLPNLKGKLDGIALRVPTPVVSICDLVCEIGKEAQPQEINNAFEKASKEKQFANILSIETKPLVSSDYKGSPYSAIIDTGLTRSLGNLIKALVWYDNEYGYASRLADMAQLVSEKL